MNTVFLLLIMVLSCLGIAFFLGFEACLRAVVDLQLKTNVKMIKSETLCLNEAWFYLEPFMALWIPKSVF